MCRHNLCFFFLLLSLTGVCAAGSSPVPTTSVATETTNNTSAADSFLSQSNGNSAPANVSKLDVHTLLYPGATTKVYAHLMLWFGGSNHMNVGYSSADPAQIHRQITDMISRGIDGVIIDWYGPNNNTDDATKLVMSEAEAHPGFSFAIMVDQGAIKWNSCSGCSPQTALICQLQYVEQTYFPSPAYMKSQGRPVVTNFDIDLSYSIDWDQVSTALFTQPVFLFQNNSGFTHTLSGGSYSWVMPTTTDYGMGYLGSFYDAGLAHPNEQTVGASYKGFDDSLASWGSHRVMGQQCGQIWLQTFSEINKLYNSGNELPMLQLVTWNDYEEGTEIETGIDNCVTISASVSGTSLQWSLQGNENTVDHYVAYVSTDGKNLMPFAEVYPGNASLNLCSHSLPEGSYTGYVQVIGKPSITNHMSAGVKITLSCGGGGTTAPKGTITIGASPSAMILNAGGRGTITVTVAPQSGSFGTSVALSCSGLPANLRCLFSPDSVIPGASAVTSMLTVKDIPAAAAERKQRRSVVFAAGLLPFSLFGITLVGKFRRQCFVAFATIAVVSALMVGTSCGGGNSTKTVNATSAIHSYALAINGVAGLVQVSTTVTITIK